MKNRGCFLLTSMKFVFGGYESSRAVGQQRRCISPWADDLSCGTTAEDEQVADSLLTIITVCAC